MHDNPDPDAIATGWAVGTRIEDKLAEPTRIIGGGAIVRAENRHMLDLLSPPIDLVKAMRIVELSAKTRPTPIRALAQATDLEAEGVFRDELLGAIEEREARAQTIVDEGFAMPHAIIDFEALLHRYEPVVFRTCLRYLHNEQDAEEACQDTFLRVFYALPKFEGRAKFRTWLFRIVMNVRATRFAKISKLAGQHRDLLDTAELREGYEPKAHDFAEVTGVVGEGLDLLSSDDRHVLILRHIGQLSFDELAATLEINLSAAKMRFYRAEQRLAIAYEKVAKDLET